MNHTKTSVRQKSESKFCVGQCFGEWTVVGRDGAPVFDWSRSSQIGLQVEVECSCGARKMVSSSVLLRGKSRSCDSCSRSPLRKGTRNPSWKGVGQVPLQYFSHVKAGALKRGLSFDITIEEVSTLFEAQKGLCSVSGLPISLEQASPSIRGGPESAKTRTASLDRIDSSKGYVAGNVHWVHQMVNLAKNVFSLEDFIHLCETVTLYQKEKGHETT